MRSNVVERVVTVIPAVSQIDILEETQNVAAYCRVSSDSLDQKNSYLAQLDEYTKVIKANSNWHFCGIYADEGITGTRVDKRDEFQRLLKDCRKGKISHILVKSISRFARNMVDALESIRYLTSFGVSVYFEKENINTKLMDSEMMLAFHSLMAQQESDSISQNMRWGIQKRMEKGTFQTTSRPYGYDTKDGRLFVNPTEALVVKDIFCWYLNGASTQAIAQKLCDSGIKKVSGETKWKGQNISYILKNEKYIGDNLLQKSYTTTTLPRIKKMNYGEMPVYYFEDTQEAIISKADYEKVKHHLEEQGGSSRRPRPHHFLTQKIVCSECGSFYRKKDNRKSLWGCTTHTLDAQSCSMMPVQESEVHSAFVVMWNRLQIHKVDIIIPYLDFLLDIRCLLNTDNPRLSELNKEIEQLRLQSHTLNGLKANGYLDSVFFMTEQSSINRKITDIRKEIQTVNQAEQEDEEVGVIRSLLRKLHEAPPHIDTFDEELFDSAVASVRVTAREVVTFCLYGGILLEEKIMKPRR